MKLFFTLLASILLCGTINATVFTSSVTSGNWTNAASWTRSAITGTNTTPTSFDDIIIVNTHTITLDLATCVAKSVTINTGGTLKCNSKTLYLAGNLTNNGNLSGTFLKLYLAGVNATLSSVATFTCGGDWYVQKTCTIAAGTVVNRKGLIVLQNNSVGIVNFGTVILSNTSASATNGRFSFSTASNFWINKSGSSVSLAATLGLGAPGRFFCTDVPNLVTYTTKSAKIEATTYYNLTVTALTTKTLTARIKVLNNLTLSGGATNSINTNGHSISVGGNLVIGGKINFTANTDTMIFNGAGNTQIVSGTVYSPYANMQVNNVGGGVRFTANTGVTRDLVMTNGDCNSNGFLGLVSDATATARIAEITSPGSVSFTGNMSIQKHYASAVNTDYAPFYHDLSSPVQSSTISDWDNELYISGIGPYDGIGGPSGVDGDVYNGTPSMHIYDEATATWMPQSGSGTVLNVGTGYDLLLLDAMDGNLNGVWNTKTIDTKGVPNFGDISVPVSIQNDGWNLIGNPYASAITCTTGVTSLSGGVLPTWVWFTENGNYTQYPMSSTVILPHQGFWMEMQGGPAFTDVTFSESCKVADYTTDYHRKAANYDIKLTLASNSASYSHENFINFNNDATVNFDKALDAKYHKFPMAVAPALYMIDEKSDVKLIRNQLNEELEEVTIPLGIFTPKAGVYYIDASVVNMNSYNYAWIENKKTGAKFDLNSPVAVEAQEMSTNMDYVLHLSKINRNTVVVKTVLENDLTIFSTENNINLKSNITDHTITEVLVFDMNGKLVLSQSDIIVVAGNISKIDISNLTNGIYVVKATDIQGNVKTTKLVK